MYKSVAILKACLDMSFDNIEIIEEKQNAAYEGFYIPKLNVRSRLAKQTPKKAGFFVTHYVADGDGNRPYTVKETLNMLAICIPDEGAFLFPKEILMEKKIITTSVIGKMGFRVYLPTEIALNASAQKTQAWQAKYYYSVR
jgi:hypothetical protein